MMAEVLLIALNNGYAYTGESVFIISDRLSTAGSVCGCKFIGYRTDSPQSLVSKFWSIRTYGYHLFTWQGLRATWKGIRNKGSSPVERILAILIESGVLYLVVWVYKFHSWPVCCQADLITRQSPRSLVMFLWQKLIRQRRLQSFSLSGEQYRIKLW
jgi:hypothetical protein